MILGRVPLYLSLLCSVALSLFSAQALKDSKLRATAEDDIREVILKRQMMEWATSGDKNEKEAKTKTDRDIAHRLNFQIFFVEVEKKDPSEAFLKRFSEVPRIVKGVSESTVGKQWRMAVIDKRTGQPGIRFYVDKVVWKGEGAAD